MTDDKKKTDGPPPGWREIPGVDNAGLVLIDHLPTKEEWMKQYGHLNVPIKPGFTEREEKDGRQS